MAYYLGEDGRMYAESVEELVALKRFMTQQQTSSVRKNTKSRSSSDNDSPPDESFRNWAMGLDQPLKSLLILLSQQKRVPRAEVVALAEQDGRTFPRVMDSLKEQIEKAGLKKADVYGREMEGFGSDKRTFYVAGPKLIANPL